MTSRRRRPRSAHWEDPISPLQAARHELRLTQATVCQRVREICSGGHRKGKPCKVDSSKISEYENGNRRPGMKHVIALSRVLGKTPEELGLLIRPDTPEDTDTDTVLDTDMNTTGFGATGSVAVIHTEDFSGTSVTSGGYSIPDEGTDFPGMDMRRDTFMKGIGAAAGAAAIDPFVLLAQDARENINHTKVSNEQIERLRIATYAYARNGYLTPRAQETRVSSITSDWALTQRLLGVPQTLSQRKELTDVFARLSAILSLSLFESGQHQRAQALRDAAKDAAREAGHNDLVLWIYDRDCEAADYLHTSPYDLHEASIAALDELGTSQSLTAAKVHAWAARGYADIGDELSAMAHLDHAERILGKRIAGCWPSDKGMPRGYTYAEDGFAGAMSDVYMTLGKHREAIVRLEHQATLHQEYGLPLKTATAVTRNRLRHAQALLHTGEIEGATSAATVAVSHFEGSAWPIVVRLAGQFSRDLTATDSTGTYAREFRDFLRGQTA